MSNIPHTTYHKFDNDISQKPAQKGCEIGLSDIRQPTTDKSDKFNPPSEVKMPISCIVLPLLSVSTLFAFWLMNRQDLSQREQRIMLWFTVFGLVQGAIIGLIAEPVTNPQMWWLNLLAFFALIPALIAGVYWRAIVALTEEVVEAIKRGPGRPEYAPEQVDEYCRKLAEMNAHKAETGCTWKEVEDQFGKQYNKSWRKYWGKKCRKYRGE